MNDTSLENDTARNKKLETVQEEMSTFKECEMRSNDEIMQNESTEKFEDLLRSAR